MAVLSALTGAPGPEGPLSSLNGHLLDDLRPGADPYLAVLALHVAAGGADNAAQTPTAIAAAASASRRLNDLTASLSMGIGDVLGCTCLHERNRIARSPSLVYWQICKLSSQDCK